MEILVFFFIASLTFLSDFYLINPMLTFGNITLIFSIYLYILLRDKLRIYKFSFSVEQQKNFKQLVSVYLIFVIYIFLTHIIRGEILFAVKNIILQFGTICLFFLLNYFYYQNKINILKFLYFSILIHFVFTIFQFVGFDITFTNLVPSNFLIGFIENSNLEKSFFRATGAVSSEIALANQAMSFLVIALFYYIKDKNIKNLFFLMITIFMLISTQSRAAIFSFLPIIIFCWMYFFKNSNFKNYVFLIVIISLLIFIVLGSQRYFENFLPYLFKDINLGDTHRLWTNLYISSGVLSESPLFGVSSENVWNLYNDYAPNEYNPYLRNFQLNLTPTHHNQLFYYLRYYGLIGLFLLLFLYYKIYKSVKLTKENSIRFIVGSIITLDLFFSMTHNNKILHPFIWIYISLIFMPLKTQK